MKQFGQFILVTYLLPMILLAAVVLPIVFKKYSISDAQLKNAYANEVGAYSWVMHTGPTEGIILGSSTLRYGLSTTLLKHCDSNWVNLSMDARDPVSLYFLLEKYLPLLHPKYVLIGLDPWIYSKRYYANRNKLMYLDLDMHETTKMYKLDHSIFYEKLKYILLSSYLLYKYTMNTTGIVNNVVPDDNGSVKLTRSAINFKEANKDWFEINKFHWSDVEFSYLGRIKEICHQKNVKLIFLVPPKRNDYVIAVKNKFFTEYNQWWDKINNVIGGEYILGSDRTLALSNQDSIFAEAYHLNQNGQKYYSNYVKEHLDSVQVISPTYHF